MRLVNRPQLNQLRERLFAPLRTIPPTVGTYPRGIDLELFRIFANAEWRISLKEKRVTLGGREKLFVPKEEWTYEVRRYPFFDREWTTHGWIIHEGYVSPGEMNEDGTFVPMPDIYEVPHYTSKMEDALSLRYEVIDLRRTLTVEEVDDEYCPRYRVRL